MATVMRIGTNLDNVLKISKVDKNQACNAVGLPTLKPSQYAGTTKPGRHLELDKFHFPTIASKSTGGHGHKPSTKTDKAKDQTSNKRTSRANTETFQEDPSRYYYRGTKGSPWKLPNYNPKTTNTIAHASGAPTHTSLAHKILPSHLQNPQYQTFWWSYPCSMRIRRVSIEDKPVLRCPEDEDFDLWSIRMVHLYNIPDPLSQEEL